MAYTTVTRVRSALGALGKPKAQELVVNDNFVDLNNFNQKTGTWTTSANIGYVTPAASGTSLLMLNALSSSSYTVVCQLATTVRAGIFYNATTTMSNYQAVMIDVASNEIRAVTVSTGTESTSNVGFTGSLLASTFYTLKVVNTGVTGEIWLDGTKQADITSQTFNSGVCCVIMQGSASSSYVKDFQVTIDGYYYSDSEITTAIAVSQALIDRRTQKTYSTALASLELYDFKDAELEEMPYEAARFFNSLGVETRGQIEDKHSYIILKNRPVYSTVLLAEDVNADGDVSSWTTRTQGRANDFVLYRESGVILFIDNKPKNGHQNIRASYNYGMTTVPEDVAELCTHYSVRKLFIGYGGGGNQAGMKEAREQNDKYIELLEDWIPPATLVGVVNSRIPRWTTQHE